MNFTCLVPNVFYTDINIGIQMFVDCLGFTITYDDRSSSHQPFCVVASGNLKVHLVENIEFAAKDRPELRLETDDIDVVYQTISAGYPQLLHPNLSTVTLRPWNAKEFALVDASGVCIIIQQWIK